MIGKHYVVTGGTSGLGLEIVKALLSHGAKVTLIIRDIEKYQSLSLNKYKGQIQTICCDLEQQNDIIALTSQWSETIDGIIYSSGLGYFKSIAAHSNKEMIETYAVNLLGFHLLFYGLAPYLVNGASIVAISSQAAFVTQAHAAHYSASKAALNASLNALRIESPELHVMVVNAGPIRTPFHKKADPTMTYATKYSRLMIEPEQLAHRVIKGIIRKEQEINQPTWMHQMLKIYQLAPRTFERIFAPLFKNKM